MIVRMMRCDVILQEKEAFIVEGLKPKGDEERKRAGKLDTAVNWPCLPMF